LQDTQQRQQKNVWRTWSPFADAGDRMSAAGLQYLALRMMIQFGEFLFLLPMIDVRCGPIPWRYSPPSIPCGSRRRWT